MGMIILAVYFLFSKAIEKIKASMARVPYNKLLTDLACLSRTGEYWPSVDSCTCLAALGPYCHNLGQYSLVRPSHSVSKRLEIDTLSDLCTVQAKTKQTNS